MYRVWTCELTEIDLLLGMCSVFAAAEGIDSNSIQTNVAYKIIWRIVFSC